MSFQSNAANHAVGAGAAGEATAQPIFILAPSDFPSALVGAMIGRHPECFGAPELNLLVGGNLEDLALTMPQPRNSQFHGLMRVVGHLFAGEQNIITVEMARRWMMRRLSMPGWQVFEELRVTVAPLRLVDPSRVYSTKTEPLENIVKAYPRAQFVHLTDDGTGGQAKGPARPLMMLRAERSRKALESFIAGLPPEQVAALSVAELLLSPEATLSALCEKLGLASDAACLESMLHPERSPFAGFGPAGANLGNDQKFLENPHFARLEHAAHSR
jgi:hypothetical protein